MENFENSSNAILGKIREAFQASFDVDPQLITLQTSASDIPGWDSVGHLSLASNLEQIFQINLDVDELMDMESVSDIVRILESKLSKTV